MGSAGYGNHEDAADVAAERPSAKAASEKPGAGSQDRPGMDLGGAGDHSAAQVRYRGGQQQQSQDGEQGLGDHAARPRRHSLRTRNQLR